MANKTSTRIKFNTSYENPVMVQIYADLSAEHKMPDGTPSAWAVPFAATKNGRFAYNRVIYVRQCNIRPTSNGKLVDCMPICHAAVVFMMSDEISHILLIREDSALVRLLRKHKPAGIPCKDNTMTLQAYWPSVKTSQIFAMESPEQADLLYQNFQCASLPGWLDGEEVRKSAIALSKLNQKEVYETASITVLKNVDYVLDIPELKIILHYDYVYTDYGHKVISLIQRDVCL